MCVKKIEKISLMQPKRFYYVLIYNTYARRAVWCNFIIFFFFCLFQSMSIEHIRKFLVL